MPHQGAFHPRKFRGQGGFVITLELIIIISILGFGTLVGIVMIRDALVKHYVAKQSSETLVADAAGRVLGEAIDFDEHDAPRIFFVDRSQETAYRTLIGVRDDRFTSREAVYYGGTACTGVPCIKTTSDELTSSRGTDYLSGTGNVSYFNALQGGPNYAVGRGDQGLPGHLFRESPLMCPLEPSQVQSRWMSQKVASGEPCESIKLEDEVKTPAFTGCLIDAPLDEVEDPFPGSSTALGNTNASTDTSSVGESVACDCPESMEDQGDILSLYAGAIETLLDSTVLTLNSALLITGQEIPAMDVGKICCPINSDLDEDELVNGVVYIVLQEQVSQLDLAAFPAVQQTINTTLAPMAGDLSCSSPVILKSADSVPDPNEPDANALETFAAPFWVNLPGAASDEWYSTPPTEGEGW
ncbi:hypothetical protein [Marinobacter alexandrii]|uniref:hypothetical protein n=2 Tax=Marinobacter TaxID=2742 RepID=UPI0032995CA7